MCKDIESLLTLKTLTDTLTLKRHLSAQHYLSDICALVCITTSIEVRGIVILWRQLN